LKKKKDPTGSLRLRLEFTPKKPELVHSYDWFFRNENISCLNVWQIVYFSSHRKHKFQIPVNMTRFTKVHILSFPSIFFSINTIIFVEIYLIKLNYFFLCFFFSLSLSPLKLWLCLWLKWFLWGVLVLERQVYLCVTWETNTMNIPLLVVVIICFLIFKRSDNNEINSFFFKK
jgi:hypothetical protein